MSADNLMSDAVMVPREPTEAMIEAAERVGMGFSGSDMDSADMTRFVWSAMLAASTPVEGWEEPVAWLRDYHLGHDDNPCLGLAQPDDANAFPVYAAPPPPSVSTDNGSRPQEAVPTEGHDAAVVADDGWIEHDGGPNPVPGEMVFARWDGGEDTKPWPSEKIAWSVGIDGQSYVTAYRITPQPADGCSSNEGAGQVRNPRNLWASDLTDDELAGELKWLDAKFAILDAAVAAGDELGGGSPCEGLCERHDEITREIAKRSSILPQTEKGS